jgi:hypothetical protein
MRQSRLVFPRRRGEAYERVKANKGAAGVDEQTIKDFWALNDNLENYAYYPAF